MSILSVRFLRPEPGANPTAPARCKAVGQPFQVDAVYLVCAKPEGLGQPGKADVHTLRCRTNAHRLILISNLGKALVFGLLDVFDKLYKRRITAEQAPIVVRFERFPVDIACQGDRLSRPFDCTEKDRQRLESMRPIDETHRLELTSWIESANTSETEFPIQNLPFCRFQVDQGSPELGVAIGDQLVRLKNCIAAGLLGETYETAATSSRLNEFMRLSVEARIDFRKQISRLLSADTAMGADSTLREQVERGRQVLIPQSAVELLVPCEITDYTDFYASVFHATNVGSMFRPTNPLLPNYKHIPIGYHGRASSIIASGATVRRPRGQLSPPEEGGMPTFGPCKMLDYELEVGFFVAQGNPLGHPVSIEDAEDYLFGMCLVNDWSARDIQKWEYQPLGPFLAKSFATSVSPWVITMEALAPFRCAAYDRPASDPKPLDYLRSTENERSGGVALDLEVFIGSRQMQEEGIEPVRVSQASFRQMYWTSAQMLTHHASNGCNLQPGDLIASGTVSGPERSSRGCMLELTWDGDQNNPLPGSQRTALRLPTGEERIFLQDGDEVILHGTCQADGFRSIGFGVVSGTVAGQLSQA